ncbi:MAG: hypothetical protein LAN37_14335 [Acidobacteriia bacterium]|nr:hypothetical protein [Terriglobia bacterium]
MEFRIIGCYTPGVREFKECLCIEPQEQFAAPARDIVAKLEKALGPGQAK